MVKTYITILQNIGLLTSFTAKCSCATFGRGPTSLPIILATLSSSGVSVGALLGPPPVARWLALIFNNFALTLVFWSFHA